MNGNAQSICHQPRVVAFSVGNQALIDLAIGSYVNVCARLLPKFTGSSGKCRRVKSSAHPDGNTVGAQPISHRFAQQFSKVVYIITRTFIANDIAVRREAPVAAHDWHSIRACEKMSWREASDIRESRNGRILFETKEKKVSDRQFVQVI